MRSALAMLFACQFVLLDLAFGNGARIGWIESFSMWAVVSIFGTTRRRRALAGAFAALLVVVQVHVFRYYHVPLDVQVASSALFAWTDVRAVVVKALPSVLAWTAALGAFELAVLELAHRGRSLARLRRPALGLAAFAGLFGGAPRFSTPDVRGLHALVAFRDRPKPTKTGVPRVPPLHAPKAIPHVLVILGESIRAEDYAAATAPEVFALPRRFDLHQMRAVASYTAVSFSAVVTGRSQEGPRDDILSSPSLFDYAHAARDARGARPVTCLASAQSEEVFETKSMRSEIDDVTTVETLAGHDPENDPDAPDHGWDRLVVDRLVTKLPTLGSPSFVFLHLADTHAPYFVEAGAAPFTPYGHITAWSQMDELHNAYKNAIYLQDREVARAVRAFIARAGTSPWFVLFTSDHGEAFSEHGAIHHGQNLYDEQVHVPAFVLAGNGALDAQQEAALADHAERPVTHLDIVPTVLDAMGLYDAFALDKAKLIGKSLLRSWVPRAAFPVTNCTQMFPCPMNTWGLYENDHKLQARIFDTSWTCTRTVPGPEVSIGDPTCEHLRAESRRLFPLLPNGAPNR